MSGRSNWSYWRSTLGSQGVLIALAIAGCAKPQPQLIEVAIDCPHATASQMLKQVAIPWEVAFAGMPGLEISSISDQGKARVFLKLTSRGAGNRIQEIKDRIQSAGKFSLNTSAPKISEIGTLPILDDGPLIEVLEIQPIEAALKQHGIDEPTLWSLIAKGCDPEARIDQRQEKLTALTAPIGGRQVLLTEIAKIERKQEPASLARIEGVSAAKYKERTSRP